MVRTSARWILSALLPVALTACGGTAPEEIVPGQPNPSGLNSEDPVTAHPPPTAATVAMQFAWARADAASTAPFWAASDATVEVATDLAHLASGTHTLVQQVTAPDGSPYQSCSITFDPAAPAAAAGTPESSCAVAALAGEAGALRLWNTLALDGAAGTWSVRAYLDGATDTSASATFTTRAPAAIVQFAGTQTSPVWGTAFTLATTPRVEIATDLSGFAAGAHAVRIDVLDTDGLLYFTFHASFDPSSCELVQGACRIWETLAITGGTIEQYQRTGTWTVQAVVDSAAAPLATGTIDLK